ncbi:MAG TPA: hypothetical protein VL442_16910 [Mucilaginibacter sp.]|nr:hypothetical protein [Mucilaginibacter sp.]
MLILFAGCKSNNSSSAHYHHQLWRFPYKDTSFKWKNFERQNDELKQKFIQSHPSDVNEGIKMYLNPYGIPPEPGKPKSAIHILDINNDGIDDIIYEGYSGGEPTLTAIYLNTPNGFKLIFKDEQYVAKLDFKDKRLSAIYMVDPGCCAAYMVFSKIYQIDFKDDMPVVKRVFFTGHYQLTEFPAKYLNSPVKLKTINDNVKLRTKPLIANNDSLFLSGDIHMGNDLGKIQKGGLCKAIAKMKDVKGNEWWFVEVDPMTKISGHVFYDDTDTNKGVSAKLGWVRSIDVTNK